jgi:hypothetical protein
MHLLSKGCSGGSCPAVYDDDPDLTPEELAIVGKLPGAGLLSRLADRVAPDEAAIVIERALVTEALRPAPEPVSDEDLRAQFETFSYSAVRFETLQSYAVPAEDDQEELATFEAGRPRRSARGQSQWAALVEANHRWGKTHRRIRIVTEPLTAYAQWELTWGYEPNVAAHEDIRIVPVAAGAAWPALLPARDFWLVDSSRLYVMHYGPDGQWAGAERVRDPEQIVDACRACDAALHRWAIPWHDYIASRPELQRRLAQ